MSYSRSTHPPAGTLSAACKRIDQELVKQLLEDAANVEEMDASQDTPLVLAAKDGHSEIVKILNSAGTPPDVGIDKGHSALFHAC